MATADRLHELYERMYDRLGPQGWWSGDSPFEVMVGAVLTQNTNWKNVERAIDNLKGAGLLAPDKLVDLPTGLSKFKSIVQYINKNLVKAKLVSFNIAH